MNRVVLWGHHLDEYQDMFSLPASFLSLRCFEFCSGPSAFQAEFAAKQGVHPVVSCDPWFAEDATTLAKNIERSFSTRLAQIKACQAQFDWSRYENLDAWVAYRRQGIAEFLKDYVNPKGHYLSSTQLPLPFKGFSFDLALSAHYLFSGFAEQTVEHHVQVIQELARVAEDVRIFPLVDAQGIPSALLGPVLLALQKLNYGVELRNVSYHMQPKGDAMLRVWAHECPV